jgi:hypothetical protein
MRTVLQALKELLDPRIVQDGALELRETDPGSTCQPTKLDRSGQAVALRFEPWSYRSDLQLPTNRWLFPLFDVKRSEPPICRSCDYIIFYAPADETEQIFVFMCELKSGSPRTKTTMTQVRNGMLLARYILDVVDLHGNVQKWPDVQFRGLIFAGDAPGSRGGLRGSARPRYQQDAKLTDLHTLVEQPGRYDLRSLCG